MKTKVSLILTLAMMSSTSLAPVTQASAAQLKCPNHVVMQFLAGFPSIAGSALYSHVEQRIQSELSGGFPSYLVRYEKKKISSPDPQFEAIRVQEVEFVSPNGIPMDAYERFKIENHRPWSWMKVLTCN